MGNHAYMITCHSNFTVLETCLKLVNDRRNSIFIVFDKKAKVKKEYKYTLKKLVDKAELIFLPDQIMNWGGTQPLRQNYNY